MTFSEQDLLHIAKLAALDLSSEEMDSLRADLSNILEYVNALSKLPTEGVVPTSHVHGSFNAFRDDIIKDSLSVDSIQQNAASFGNGGFRVPKVI